MIGEHTDRVYTNTPPEHIITNVVSGRKMRVQKYNFPDTVIWNPWVDKAKEIPDFGNYFYHVISSNHTVILEYFNIKE